LPRRCNTAVRRPHDARPQDPFSAGQFGEIDAVPGAIETQLNAAMSPSLALQPLANAGFHHQIDGALLEHTRANPLLDVLLGTRFENDRFDALQMKKMSERESRGACSDDSDLSPHQFILLG
jgi:hypothetical protein